MSLTEEQREFLTDLSDALVITARFPVMLNANAFRKRLISAFPDLFSAATSQTASVETASPTASVTC